LGSYGSTQAALNRLEDILNDAEAQSRWGRELVTAFAR
jgi:hypothetical protein